MFADSQRFNKLVEEKHIAQHDTHPIQTDPTPIARGPRIYLYLRDAHFLH